MYVLLQLFFTFKASIQTLSSFLCSPNVRCPTNPSTIFELQNSSHEVLELHKTRRSLDLRALKLWKDSSGGELFKLLVFSYFLYCCRYIYLPFNQSAFKIINCDNSRHILWYLCWLCYHHEMEFHNILMGLTKTTIFFSFFIRSFQMGSCNLLQKDGTWTLFFVLLKFCEFCCSFAWASKTSFCYYLPEICKKKKIVFAFQVITHNKIDAFYLKLI